MPNAHGTMINMEQVSLDSGGSAQCSVQVTALQTQLEQEQRGRADHNPQRYEQRLYGLCQKSWRKRISCQLVNLFPEYGGKFSQQTLLQTTLVKAPPHLPTFSPEICLLRLVQFSKRNCG